jgi:hypothetical protein
MAILCIPLAVHPAPKAIALSADVTQALPKDRDWAPLASDLYPRARDTSPFAVHLEPKAKEASPKAEQWRPPASA